jgi:hypothetical protein
MKQGAGWCAIAFPLLLAPGGCGPHELGAKAPEFGASKKLATTAGFLEGRWMQKIDESTARYKQPMLTGLGPNMYLDFHADHTCSFDMLHHTAHMTWKENGVGVDLSTLDVDGVDAAKVKARYDEWTSYSRHDIRRTVNERDYYRGVTLDFAKMITRLELKPDKKRLFEPKTVREGGSSFMGTDTWVRVK